MDIILNRRSVRKYNLDKKIDYDTLVDLEALKKYRMDNKIEFVGEICDEWSDIAESERKEAAL